MLKKGQLQISFGVIFSIIIIAATLATAGYIIVKVIKSQDEITCKMYNQKLQTKIDAAWASDGDISQTFREGNEVPRGTKQICFGTVNQSLISQKDKVIYENIKNRVRNNVNLIFYPINVCGENQFTFTLQHIKTDGFFCVNVVSNKAEVQIAKGLTDAFVKLCPLNSNCTIGDSIVSDSGSVSGIIAPGSPGI